MKPILHWKKSKPEAQFVAGITRRAKRKSSIHINTRKTGHEGLVGVAYIYIAVHADELRSTTHSSKVWRSPWRRVRCAVTEKR
jgi:hypothetical protein